MNGWVAVVRRNRAGLLVLLTTWLAFFWRHIFLGKVYWLEDLQFLFYPLEHVYGQFQRGGNLPIWSPTFGFGHPLMSWGQLGFFTPLHLLLRMLSLHALDVLTVSTVVYFAAGLLGMYVFLRRRDLSEWAGVLGAVVFAFNGYNVSHIIHPNFHVGVMLVPWLLVCVDALLAHATARRAAAVGLVAGVIVSSAQPQIALYSLALAGIVTVWSVRRYTRKLVSHVVLAGMIGAAMSSVALLPLIEFLPHIDRTEGLTIDELYNFSYPPWHAITLIFPTFFGDRDNYHGADSLQELGGYTGIIPLLLAGAALAAKGWRRRERLMALSLAGLGVLLALGEYSLPYRFLVENEIFPPFTAPSRFLLFFVFGIAVLAALGLDSFRREADQRRRIRMLLSGVVLVGLMLAPAVVVERERIFSALGTEEWAAAAGVLVYFVGAAGMRMDRMRRLWPGAVAAVTATTLAVFGWMVYPVVDRAVAVTPPAFANELAEYGRQHGIPARLYSEREILQEDADAAVPSDTRRTDALGANFFVQQPFRAARDDLSCLVLGIESNRTGTDPIRMTVGHKGEAEPLRMIEVTPADITDAGRQRFCFEPIADSAGQEYTVVLEAKGEGGDVVLFYRLHDESSEQAYFVRVRDPSDEQLSQSRKQARLVVTAEYGRGVDPDQMLLLRHLNATVNAGSARWIGALSVRRYRDFVKELFANDRATADGNGVHVMAKNRQLFDVAGVTHAAQMLRGDAHDFMPGAGWRVVAEDTVRDARYRLYENERVLERVFLVPRGVALNERAEVLEMLQEPAFDPTKVVFIERADGAGKVPDAPERLSRGGAKILRYEPARVDVAVAADGPAWLVLTDTFTPMWHTYIDDIEAPQYIAHLAFRAAYVPAGKHIVSFRYESQMIGLAVWLAGTALFAAGVLVMPWGHLVRRLRQADSP